MDGGEDVLQEVELRAWRGLIGTFGRLQSVLDSELSAAGSLRLGEYEVMAHLREAPDGAMRMNELAARCGLSPSGLTRRFDGLAKRGWVERRAFPSDRRGVLAALTTDGAEVLEHCAPHHVAAVRRHFLSRLSDSEVAVLAEVFGRVSPSNGSEARAVSGTGS